MPKKTEALNSADWIDPLEAVHLISPRVGGDRKAKKAITERLMDGAVDATAWWLAFGVDVGRPYLEPRLVVEFDEGEESPNLTLSQIEEKRRSGTAPLQSITQIGDGLAITVMTGEVDGILKIGGAFWSSARKEDMLRWSWANSFFLSTSPADTWRDPRISPIISSKFAYRSFALGVKFKRGDILRIGDQRKQEVSVTPPPSSRRGRKLSETWPLWVAALVELLEEGRKFSTSGALAKAVADRLAKRGDAHPSDNTVIETAQAVIEALGRSTLNQKPPG